MVSRSEGRSQFDAALRGDQVEPVRGPVVVPLPRLVEGGLRPDEVVVAVGLVAHAQRGAAVVAALEVQLAGCRGRGGAGLLGPGVGARPQVHGGARPVGVRQIRVVDVLVGGGGVGLGPGGVQRIGAGVGPTAFRRTGVVQEHRVEVGVGRQVGVGGDQSAARVLPAGHLLGSVDGHGAVAVRGDRDRGALGAGGRGELFAVGALVDQAGVAGADEVEAGADGVQGGLPACRGRGRCPAGRGDTCGRTVPAPAPGWSAARPWRPVRTDV